MRGCPPPVHGGKRLAVKVQHIDWVAVPSEPRRHCGRENNGGDQSEDDSVQHA